MKTTIFVVITVILLGCSLKVLARPQSAAPGQKTTTVSTSKTAKADQGAQRFQQNCGRCHNPPDSLSPREVKAVLQHMRVRAMLSAEDEKLILKFLAP
jgi:cytochrome c5